MAINVRDRKLLWGRSGNRCAICKCELIEPVGLNDASVVSEEAHIVAESADGPRADSSMPESERNSYPNLVLLCPSDHTRIDKPEQVEKFTRDELHRIKREHEEWVSQRLGSSTTTDDEWLELVADFTRRSSLHYWNAWMSNLASPIPFLPPSIASALSNLSIWFLGRIWPSGHGRLRNSFANLEKVLAAYLDIQNRFFEEYLGRHELIREYKRQGWLPQKKYQELAAEFDALVIVVDFYVKELTCAANDLCCAVRETIHRSFRRVDGHLLVTSGPYGFFEYRTDLYIYEAGTTEYQGTSRLVAKLGPDMSQRLGLKRPQN